ncbi:MAG: DNA integrity scanning protein DisA nucleotide-binding domain protein [Planctomycetota bacterium]
MQQGLLSHRGSLYGVRTVHFLTETPGARELHAGNRITLALLGTSLASTDPATLDLALADLAAIKAESPQYPVVVLVDELSAEDDARLRKLGFETIISSDLASPRAVRDFVENKVIELRLGITPELIPETVGLAADDPTLFQALKYEFAGATPPPELWSGSPAKTRRNLIITFTFFARACRRLASRVFEGHRAPAAFVLTQRSRLATHRLGGGANTLFRFPPEELRVSLGGVHQFDMDAIARVSRWPGSFVVVDDLAMIRAVVATPPRLVHQHAPGLAFGGLVRGHADVGFLLPGDGSVRVFSIEREVLRHDGFQWRSNNRLAVRAAFAKACGEVSVPESTAFAVFEAAMVLAEQKMGAFFIVGDSATARRIAKQSVPLNRRLTKALEEGAAVGGASPYALATLAQQDGALIVEPKGRILGFGRLLRTRERPKDDATHGTKHATAAQLTRERKGVCALVVSQDGPASVFFHGEIVARTQF